MTNYTSNWQRRLNADADFSLFKTLHVKIVPSLMWKFAQTRAQIVHAIVSIRVLLHKNYSGRIVCNKCSLETYELYRHICTECSFFKTHREKLFVTINARLKSLSHIQLTYEDSETCLRLLFNVNIPELTLEQNKAVINTTFEFISMCC